MVQALYDRLGPAVKGGVRLPQARIEIKRTVYMNQIARHKWTHEAVDTTIIPKVPRPANTTSRVIHNKPAGVAVVGELSSSNTTSLARISFATKPNAKNPATQEHMKWKYSAILYACLDVSQ